MVSFFFCWQAVCATTTLLDISIQRLPKGPQLVLHFDSAVPDYRKNYFPTKNVTQLKWKGVLSGKVRTFEFFDSNIPFTRIVIGKARDEGVLQIWHRENNDLRLDIDGPNHLILPLTAMEEAPTTMAAKPMEAPTTMAAKPMDAPTTMAATPKEAARSSQTQMPKPSSKQAPDKPLPNKQAPSSTRISSSAQKTVFAPSLPKAVSRAPASEIPARLTAETPKTISLSVKDAPLSKILRTIASEFNRSMVFSDDVSGNVSVSLSEVPFEKAVETVLKPTKYRAEHTPNSTIIRDGKLGKSFRKFQLEHVDVNVLKASLTEIAKDAQITVDNHTNSIFVVDTVESLNSMQEMLATLDKPARQVEVEAAIIDIQKQKSQDLGFSFNAPPWQASGRNLNPQSPTDANAQGLFLGLSWNTITGILSVLQTRSGITLLARPRLLAINDQEATIVIGSKLGYKTLTKAATGETLEQVNFLVVGTQLKIKPHITSGGSILMYIRPEISDGQIDARTNLPTEKTTNTETKVSAKNGQTIVLGGLLRDRTERIEAGIPILSDIPVLGMLFRSVKDQVIKSEIMILLTPRIVDDSQLTIHEKQSTHMIEKVTDNRIQLLPVPSYNGENGS